MYMYFHVCMVQLWGMQVAILDNMKVFNFVYLTKNEKYAFFVVKSFNKTIFNRLKKWYLLTIGC